MTKMSLIIPVYNVENYLRECLDSCINQTLKDIEIICVNDCSPDDSASILEEYAMKDSRIRIVTHKENKGLGGARNTGVENASGEYIWFIDSDDFIALDACEFIFNNSIKYKSPDMIIIGFSRFNNRLNNFEGDVLYEDFPKEQYFSSELITNAIKLNCISACFKICKRNLYKDFRFLENMQAEDIPTFYLFFLIKNFLIINKPFYKYRILRDGSIVTTTSINMHYGVLFNTYHLYKLMDSDSNIPLIERQMVKTYMADRVFKYKHIYGYLREEKKSKKLKMVMIIKDIILNISSISDDEKKIFAKCHNNFLLLFKINKYFGVNISIWMKIKNIIIKLLKFIHLYDFSKRIYKRIKK